MTVNRFDQASRYAAKRDAVGFLSWLLRESAEELRFRAWLDTRTLPFPGETDRTCDTVAWLGDADSAIEWAVPIEFCLQSIADLFGRLLIYLGQLWLEKRPTDAGGERFCVAAVTVNLTGRGRTSKDMLLRRTGARTLLQVVECNMCDESAASVLDGIAAGSVSRCLLPWIALMQGGEEVVTIERWKELALGEPDSRLRADYGGLALVFAEAAGRRVQWKEALKEWNMIESQQVLEWMQMGEARGEARGLREGLLEGIELALKLRFGAEGLECVPSLRRLTEIDALRRIKQALETAKSLDDIRRLLP